MQPDLIEPLAAHQDRMVMQADQHMLVAMKREHVPQVRERLCAYLAGGRTRHPGIQHHDQPSAELDFTTDLEGCPARTARMCSGTS